MQDGLRVAIIGAGIGGLAAARALAMRGAHVSVYEQAPEITEVGAGLQISPNGMKVLDALGLGEGLRDSGAPEAAAVCLKDYRGAEVLRLDLKRIGARGYHCVHRADLIALLADGARAAGAKIRLLQKVKSASGGAQPSVVFASGQKASFDLVIGADGVHSVVRAALGGAQTPFFTGHAAWRAVIANTQEREGEVWVHMGPGRHLVSYPLRGGKLLNLVAVQEQSNWVEESWALEDTPANLCAAFADFGVEAREMLAAVERVGFWGLFRHDVAKRWHGEGLALLGDAVHPTLPFLAQGAVMALEDAWVLADEIASLPDLGMALARYQQRREARVRRVVKTATGNARKYHLSFPPLRLAAHSALRLGGALAPGLMMRQFDWLYGHDVTTEGGQGISKPSGASSKPEN